MPILRISRRVIPTAITAIALTAGAQPAGMPNPYDWRPVVGQIPSVWLGVVKPMPADVTPCDCAERDVLWHAAAVSVFAARGGPSPNDVRVYVVQPLLGMSVHGEVIGSRVEVPAFLIDRRAHDDGVFVIDAHSRPVFVALTTADATAIRDVVARAESLEGVKRAVDKLEIGTVDLDGDDRADIASTYGCKVWGDGKCQVPGQFFLEKRRGKWQLLE